ncbi:DUF1707 domain-containing protein [Amycolatopsis sp.]|uniref:DUF1707 SHOCT-like domain-containing protein n=1 Tax=Amycolatopsis sp. TaxID=37632 RepID=UPI002B58C406|nr:DUF1707 domain-containing protein [Amycolatopsis sp.]HVV14126.1 DUF1707 domain-containing protein [Amycolatopsis sp.]
MRASNADRERVAQILHNALSEGRITVQELEERLDTVYAAKTLDELQPPIADLPGVTPGAAVQAAPSHEVDTRLGGIPGSQTSIAVMSGASRKGNWVVPPNHNSFAFWGGVDMDLRDARFAERHSTITAVAIMGGIDIIVPDDIIVDVNGIGFMGAFDTVNKGAVAATPPPGAPVLKVTGFAFWGAVTVIRKPRKRRLEN